jgi:hypothetical protein
VLDLTFNWTAAVPPRDGSTAGTAAVRRAGRGSVAYDAFGRGLSGAARGVRRHSSRKLGEPQS